MSSRSNQAQFPTDACLLSPEHLISSLVCSCFLPALTFHLTRENVLSGVFAWGGHLNTFIKISHSFCPFLSKSTDFGVFLFVLECAKPIQLKLASRLMVIEEDRLTCRQQTLKIKLKKEGWRMQPNAGIKIVGFLLCF